MSDPTNAFGRCPCGHLWLSHDVEEYTGDGSETCCVHSCRQEGCPGRRDRTVDELLEDMAPDLLRINPGAAETAARVQMRLRYG